jgi:general secretion pathway protein H
MTRQAGFTLLEMLVTMLVVAVALALGGSVIARRDMTPTPAQVARQLQATFLQARSDAVRRGRDAAVLVDIAGRRFAYPEAATPVPLPDGTDVRLVAGAVASDGGRTLVVFRADGSSSGADLILADGRHADARVAVNWLTGLPQILLEPPR